MQGFFSFRVFGVWFFLPTLQERKERMEKAAQRTGSSPSAWRLWRPPARSWAPPPQPRCLRWSPPARSSCPARCSRPAPRTWRRTEDLGIDLQVRAAHTEQGGTVMVPAVLWELLTLQFGEFPSIMISSTCQLSLVIWAQEVWISTACLSLQTKHWKSSKNEIQILNLDEQFRRGNLIYAIRWNLYNLTHFRHV